MTGIQGDLEVVGLANLLQVLSLASGEGFLSVREGAREKTLHLSRRGLRLVAGARPGRPLGEILVRTGRIGRAHLPWFLAMHRGMNRPLGEVLVRCGFLDSGDLDRLLRERVLEEIYDLFTWRGASFRYRPAGEAPAPVDEGPLSTLVVECDVVALMLEAVRRMDELSRIRSVIPDADGVVERRISVELELSPDLEPTTVEEVLSLVDGRRTIGEIVEESVFPRFTVLRTLYALAVGGAVAIHSRVCPLPEPSLQ
jgi:hypothetical protein